MIVIKKWIILLITTTIGSFLIIYGSILTYNYLIIMGARWTICMCYVIDIGLFYSILVNFGISLILFGLNYYFKSIRLLFKSTILVILGISLISFFILILFDYIEVDYDLTANFIPYFITGLILLILSIRGIKIDLWGRKD
ncbi:MAG: hypothetical protein ACFFBI_14205 [Promethearchaeota archaeon]